MAEQNDIDLELIEKCVRQAGDIALQYFRCDPEVWWKEGDSPVSQADYAVDEFLKAELMFSRENYGWLSEETADDENRLEKNRVFVVDPIDGTRGFIKGVEEWCVSVAVVENGRPVVGMLYAPALNQSFTAVENRGAKFYVGEMGKECGIQEFGKILNVSSPKSYFDILQQQSSREMKKVDSLPSLAWRLALIAKGENDLVVVKENSHEWDMVAADIIVCEAGGTICDLQGEKLLYNQSDTEQNKFFACKETERENVQNMLKDIK